MTSYIGRGAVIVAGIYVSTEANDVIGRQLTQCDRMYDGFLVFIRQSVPLVVYFAGAGDGCKRMVVIYQLDDLVAVKESGDILGVTVVDGRLLVRRRTVAGVVTDSARSVITPGIQLAAFG